MEGKDKLLEPVDGEPLLIRVVRRAIATGCRVLVTVPPDSGARIDALRGVSAETVAVPDAQSGMSASFRAAAKRSAGAPVMTLFGDMPDIDTEDMRVVLNEFDRHGGTQVVRGASAEGVPGLPVVFPPRLVARFSELTGDTGGKELLKGEQVHIVRLEADRATTDLDTPDDWSAWRARRGR